MGGTLQLRLLGSPIISLDEVSVGEALSMKAQAVLIYLAITGQPQRRSVLASLLWGDMPEADARTNLRRALANLREVVGDHLNLDGQTLALKADRAYWVDVSGFVAKAGVTSSRPDMERLQEAVELYRSDFLTGYYVRNAPDFETWMLAEQARLRELFVQALRTLATHFAGRDELAKGMEYMRRLLNLEPWREEAHRQLMLLLARDGQRSAALAQYELCTRVLAEELGVEPGPETKALYERIRAGDLSRGADKPESRGELPSAPLSLRHNLPSQPTSFIGREQEVTEIRRLLVEEPACRLLTLTGPGGIGKTRLALAAAAEVMDVFAHGVHFVPLAPVSEPELVVSTVAEALQLNFQEADEPKAQLLNYLREKQLLLVVDNLEHLLEGVALWSEILSAARQVKLLATSRERLNLQEEWSYRVEGMSYPTPESPASTFEDYSAVRLFLERARRAEAGFNLSAEMPHVARICQLVDGMPLALELAAPWVRSITCQEIVTEIERSLDFLATPLRNVPERHRSIRAVLEQSWLRLPEAEKAILRKLSVFRGQCGREAAAQVTGATLSLLTALVDKALLRRDNSGRYEMHELIRQFAAEQLQAISGAEDTAQELHCAYYAGFLEKQGRAFMTGQQQKQALSAMLAEIDNIRAAWRHAVASKNTLALEKSMEGLWTLGEYGGQLYESEMALRQAVSTLCETPSGQPAAEPWEAAAIPEEYAGLVGYLLTALGHLSARLGKLDEGRALAEQALLQVRRAKHRDQRKEALALMGLGFVLLFQGRYAEAKQRGQEGLDLFASLGDRRNVATTLLLQGLATYGEGQLEEAEEFLEQALVIFWEIDEVVERGYGVQYLALIAGVRGDYARARQLLDEDLQIRQEFNDVNGMTDLLRQLSRLAIAQGQYMQAEQYIQQGLSIYKEVGRRDVRGLLGQLGSVRRLQGNYEEAERLYRESFELAKAARHQPDLAESLGNLGRLAYDRAEYDRAERYLQESLAIWQQIENETEIAAVLGQLGHLQVAQDATREREARQYYAHALQLASRHRLVPIALDIFVGAAGLLARGGDAQGAFELLGLVKDHPACTYETRQKARQHLTELLDMLPANLVITAKTQSQPLDWQIATNRLIQALISSAH